LTSRIAIRNSVLSHFSQSKYTVCSASKTVVDVGLAYTAVVLDHFSKGSQMQSYYPFREPHQKFYTS